MKKIAALILVILTILLLPQFCFAAQSTPVINSISITNQRLGP